MMNFRTVTQALIDTLGNAARGRFRVVGYQRKGYSASEVKNNKRTVQVFYSGGDFRTSAGRFTGTTQHRPTITIGLSVSAAAKVNLSMLNKEGATADQRNIALAAMQDAAYVADVLFDELAELVYQILMDARNIDLGLVDYTISDRWVDSITKDSPEPNGELLLLTGSIKYSCNTTEDIVGEVGVPMTATGISTVIDVIGDDVEQTGISTESGLYEGNWMVQTPADGIDGGTFDNPLDDIDGGTFV